MKAIVLPAYGDADRLELREVPEPKPGPNELAVRVASASINPVDWKLISGALQKYMPLELPAILGRDVAGTVVALGPGVTTFQIGARLLGFVRNAFAEIAVAPVDAWAPVPPKLDLVDAAALPLVVLTGAQLAEEAVDVRKGEVLLVTGATGSVGRATIFAAKERGARVYAGVRSAHKAEAAKLGADGVIALDDPASLDRLPPLDAIADTVGGDAIKMVLGKVKPGGRIGSVVGEPAGAKERGLSVRPMLTHADPRRLAALAQAVADGTLIIPIAKRFPISEARQAHKLAEKGAAGKVLLTF
jgi:NADPH:quinone reductase-like Zn-dependent oxidoreductase